MAGQRDYRITHTKIRIIATVSVAELQVQADKLAKEFRELDTKIQGQNWFTDLEGF